MALWCSVRPTQRYIILENALTKLWSQKRAVSILQFWYVIFKTFLEEHKASLQYEVAVLELVFMVTVTARIVYKSIT